MLQFIPFHRQQGKAPPRVQSAPPNLDEQQKSIPQGRFIPNKAMVYPFAPSFNSPYQVYPGMQWQVETCSKNSLESLSAVSCSFSLDLFLFIPVPCFSVSFQPPRFSVTFSPILSSLTPLLLRSLSRIIFPFQ